MKPVRPVDASKPNHDDIQVLHATIRYLWTLTPNVITEPSGDTLANYVAEENKHEYGKTTRQLVQEFQKNKGLPETSETDRRTARTMNEVLLGEHKLKAAIKGTMKNKPSKDQPLSGITVVLESGGKMVDEDVTGITGVYSIFSEQELQSVKVYPRVGEKTVGEPEWFPELKGLKESKLVVTDKRFQRPIEFEEIEAAIRPHKGVDENYEDFNEVKVRYIANQTKRPVEDIERFVNAHILRYAGLETEDGNDNKVDLPVEFYWGLLRTDTLLFVCWKFPPVARAEIRLKEKDDEIWVDILRDIAAFVAEGGAAPVLEEVLYRAQVDRIITGKNIIATSNKFEKTIKTNLGYLREALEPNASNPTQCIGIPGKAYRKLAIALSGETLFCDWLLKFKADDEHLDTEDVATWEPSRWARLLTEYSNTIEDEAERKAFQERIPMLSKEIAERLKKSDPSAAFAAEMARESRIDPIASSDYPKAAHECLDLGIDLCHDCIDDFDVDHRPAILELQRVMRLAPDYRRGGAVLLANGWTSASAVAAMGKKQFEREYVAACELLWDERHGAEEHELGGNGSVLFEVRLDEAREIHGKACGTLYLANTIASEAITLSHDCSMPALGMPVRDLEEPDLSDLPDLKSLFGSIDSCACEDCLSVYGPAAYLVDLLEYLKRLEAEPIKEPDGTELSRTVFDVLIERRPDIPYLELNCANAMTSVPYIDLVNEVLEDRIYQSPAEISHDVKEGKIDPTLLKKLDKYPKLTCNAWVSKDSQGWMLVRDEGILVQLERIRDVPDLDRHATPSWIVRQLRQTSLSAEELAAAPEYVNHDVYDKLKQNPRSLSLPFDLNHAEGQGYVAKMGLRRIDVMRDLATYPQRIDPSDAYWKRVAAEAFGLTSEEAKIITCPAKDDDKQRNFWGLPEKDAKDPDDTAVNHMMVLRTFMDKTGLTYVQVEELLYGSFVNRDGVIVIESIAKSDPEKQCDPSFMILSGLSLEGLDRIHRFLRLWRKTSWSIDLLDRLLASDALCSSNLNRQCLNMLAEIILLAEEADLDSTETAELYIDLSTRGEDSEYAGIYLKRGRDGTTPGEFQVAKLCLSDTMPDAPDDEEKPNTDPMQGKCECELLTPSDPKKIHGWITECLGMGEDNVKSAIEWLEELAGNRTISLGNLSRLHAWFNLATKLRLSIQDCKRLATELTAIDDPLASPVKTRQLFRIVALLRETGYSVDDLMFWLGHTGKDEEVKKRLLTQARINKILNRICREFGAIDAPPSIADEFNKADCLSVVAKALESAEGLTSEQATRLAELLESRKSDEEKEELASLISGEGFENYPEVAKLSADPIVNDCSSWPDDDGGTPECTHSAHRGFAQKLTAEIGIANVTLQRTHVVLQAVSSGLSLSVEESEALTAHAQLGGGDERSLLTILLEISCPEHDPDKHDWPADGDESKALKLVHKMGSVVRVLGMDPKLHIDWGMKRDADTGENRFERLDWLSLDALPIGPVDEDQLRAAYPKWTKLVAGHALMLKYPVREFSRDSDEETGAAKVFELAVTVPTAETSVKEILETIIEHCSLLLDVPQEELEQVRTLLKLDELEHFRAADSFWWLKKGSATTAKLGLKFENVQRYLAEELSKEVVDALRGSLRDRTSEASWLGTLKTVQNPIREAKRDALVAFLLNDIGNKFRVIDDLYDHFLVDSQMSACQGISRIVQTHTMIQLLVQRCRMGLEAQVDPDFDNDEDWVDWKWMHQYRLWEANRKIFLYPENWIEPEQRDNKSPFFTEFERELKQNDMNRETVETAGKNYLEKLDDVAFLEVMAATYQEEPSGDDKQFVMHVVARTKGGDPASYYYRQFINESNWTAWEKIDLDISTEHLMLFVRNGRPHLAWPVFQEVVDEDEKPAWPDVGNGLEKVARGWAIQLAVSERSNGRWLPKRVSREAIEVNQTQKTAAESTRLRERYRFYVHDAEKKNDDAPAKQRAASQGIDPEEGFFILCYGVREEGDSDRSVEFLGGFNLAGCKSFPEVVHPQDDYLSQYRNRRPQVPAVKDAALLEQRWVEQDLDMSDSLALSGLRGEKSRFRNILDVTPGTFRVTYPQQVTKLDRAISSALLLKRKSTLPEEPSIRWSPSGVLLPFFFEDGRRNYVVIPATWTCSSKSKTGDCEDFPAVQRCDEDTADPCYDGKIKKSMNDFLRQVRVLLPSLERELKRDDGNWERLLNDWAIDPIEGPAQRMLESYFGQPFRLKFEPFYHPFVCEMKRALDSGGFEGLMSLTSSAKHENEISFNCVYKPNKDLVHCGHPRELEEYGFDEADGYGIYNWEVFYHIPMLIATKLCRDQKFEEAMRWFHFIFNPTGGSNDVPSPQRYWITKPFRDRSMDDTVKQRINNIIADLTVGCDWKVSEWRKDPSNPHKIARHRRVAFQKATVMKYVENLIKWGDMLFRKDTMESVELARQKYVLAKRILGPRPVVVRPVTEHRSKTYRELERVRIRFTADPDDQDIPPVDAFGNALIDIENRIPPITVDGTWGERCGSGLPTGTGTYFCIPRNEHLLKYWETIDDRLEKIRNCMNIEGVERQLALFAPPIDPALLVRARAAGLSIGDILGRGEGSVPNYRFRVLAQKATELIQGTISLGASFLQALEKRDAEALAQLQATHEIEMLELAKDSKVLLVNESEKNLEALNKGAAVVEKRQEYYKELKKRLKSGSFMSDDEQDAQNLLLASDILQVGSAALDILAGVLNNAPNTLTGGAGFGGSPLFAVEMGGGSNFGPAASAGAVVFRTLSTVATSQSGQIQTKEGFVWREKDWSHQVEIADSELERLQKEKDAENIRLEIAKRAVKEHKRATKNAQTRLEFIQKRKFTNEELYEWLIDRLSELYFQHYQLAYDAALRAERAYRYELGVSGGDGRIIRHNNWDSLQKGLTAGEGLLQDLKRVELAYLERDARQYEITKHISLARVSAKSLIDLKYNGSCVVELPEILFDLDYMGHFFRRITNVSISIPCIVGPHTSVNCTLTLLNNKTRTENHYNPNDPLDGTFVNFAGVKSIATSGAQNDNGLFELNFSDERFLPFEGAGAVSTWRIELPIETNPSLDRSSISDVILHLQYTAREGGSRMRAQVAEAVEKYRQGTVLPIRLVSLPDEYAASWQSLVQQPAGQERNLELSRVQDRMPYLWNLPDVWNNQYGIESVELLALGSVAPNLKPALKETGGAPIDPDPTSWSNWHGLEHVWSLTWKNPPTIGDWQLVFDKSGDQKTLPHMYLVIRGTMAWK